MMKKISFYLCFAFISFLVMSFNVNAATDTQYYYDLDVATYKNNYSVTQITPSLGWIFSICDDVSGVCKKIDATNLKNTAYSTFTLSNIDTVIVSQGGNTDKLYFEVYFKTYTKGSLIYDYEDYYMSRQYYLYMFNSSYSGRRQVISNNVLKEGLASPEGSNYITMQFRYEYDFASNSFNTLVSPSSSTNTYVDSRSSVKINYSSLDIYNSSNGLASGINSNVYYSNNLAPSIPSYLEGYKEVTFTSEYKFLFISYIQNGSIFVPYLDYKKYNGQLCYYDLELKNQPYDCVIKKHDIMSDVSFVKIDFDISSYRGSDIMLFNKYDYLEGLDDISYSVWVPLNSYISFSKPIPNENGSNDVDISYVDENGVLHNKIISTSETSHINNSIFQSMKNRFSQFTKPVHFILDNVTDFYYSMPNKVQDFFFISFLLSTVIILIRIIT